MTIIDAHVHIDRFLFDQHVDLSGPPPSEVVPQAVIDLMDAEGVAKAVILQHPEGAINDAVAQTVREHPDRFRGAMIVPLDDGTVEAIDAAYAQGLTVIKLEMWGTTRLYPGVRLDDESVRPLYRRAEELGIVLAIDPFRLGESSYQPDEIERMVQAHPQLSFVVCHLGYCEAQSLTDPANRAQWERMTALARYDNVTFDISALPDMFAAVEAYPFPTALQFVREFIDTHGAHKALWGSDILGELSRGTYRELIDMFAASDLFTDDEKTHLLFANAERVYFASDHPAPATGPDTTEGSA